PAFIEKVTHGGDLFWFCRAQIQVRGDASVYGVSALVDRRELEPLRDHMRLAGAGDTAILYAVFQKKDGGQPLGSVGVIDQYSALPHDLFILLTYQADHRFQQ